MQELSEITVSPGDICHEKYMGVCSLFIFYFRPVRFICRRVGSCICRPNYGIGLNVTKKIRPFVLHADAIYNFPLKAKVDGIRSEYGQYLNFDLGVEYFFGNGFNLMIEGNGLLQGDRKERGEFVPGTDMKSFVVSPGIGWSNETIQTLLAYQRVVAGTNADANDSVVLTFAHTF